MGGSQKISGMQFVGEWIYSDAEGTCVLKRQMTKCVVSTSELHRSQQSGLVPL